MSHNGTTTFVGCLSNMLRPRLAVLLPLASGIYPLATFRAFLYIAFVYPMIRMLRAPRWESAIAAALFLACWTNRAAVAQPFDAR